MEDVRRLRHRDVLVPFGLFLMGAAELASIQSDGYLAAMGLEVLAAVVLIWRRIYPAVVAPLSSALLALIPLTGTRMEDAATPIFYLVLAVFCVGRHLGRKGAVVAVLTTGVVVAADVNLASSGSDWTDVVFVLALMVPPFFFGRISRKLAEQAALLTKQQSQIRDQAIRDERDRIARELHDVIAHSVSAMVVQTAAAQDLVRSSPEQAEELLESVAQTGREALAETGRLLHLIRDDGDELGLRPAPGLADVPSLVDGFRQQLTIDATLDLPDGHVPAGVDVSAYRVVQEALTNAAKHGTSPVELLVRRDGTQLRITCSNPLGTPGQGSGLGLQGMAERVAVVGGILQHGVNGDGRFHVDARLPLRETT